MENINDMMDDDGYTGYEADPLDDNYQVKCGQILVSATQKFSLRCAGCDLEYESLRDFINHCIEMHSFTDFEVDNKSNVPGRKSVFEPNDNDDSNASNIITMAPPACGSLDASNVSFNSFSSKNHNTFYDDEHEYEDDIEDEERDMKDQKLTKPLIRLKPLETLQKRKLDISDNDVRPPRKRVYEQSECRFQCKYCDKSYPYSSSLSKHRKTFHNDIKKYQCSFCDTRFTDEIFLIRHQRARHKNELKPYAEDPVIILEDYGDEFNDNHSNNSSIQNEIKNEPIDDYGTPERSVKRNIGGGNSSDLKYKLNNSFKKDKHFDSSQNSFGESSINRSNIQRPPKVIYKCTMCPEEQNITFRSKKEWQAHENHAHLQPEKFRCQICNVGYPSKKQFQDHEQEKHQDQRPFKCPICFFAFKERKHLMRHERVHTGEKPFKCPHCTEQFTRKDALKTHHLKEHLDIPFE